MNSSSFRSQLWWVRPGEWGYVPKWVAEVRLRSMLSDPQGRRSRQAGACTQAWSKHGGFSWTSQGPLYTWSQQDLHPIRLFLSWCPEISEVYVFAGTDLTLLLRVVNIQEAPKLNTSWLPQYLMLCVSDASLQNGASISFYPPHWVVVEMKWDNNKYI